MKFYTIIFIGLLNTSLYAMNDSGLDVDLATKDRKVNIAAVGLGKHFTKKLMPALLDLPFNLVGGSRRDQSQLQIQKEKLGLRFISTNYKDLLNPELIEAVVVSGPPSLHEEVVQDCLNASIHVFAEKPLSLNLELARQLNDLAIKKNVVASVGLNMMYIPSMEILKKKVRARELSELEVLCTVGAPSNLANSFKDVFIENLYFAFIHPLAFCIELMGVPNSIKTSLSKDEGAKKFELTTDLLYDDMPKQKIVFKNFQEEGFRFHIIYRDQNEAYVIDTTSETKTGLNEKQSSYYAEFADFYNSIKTGKKTRNNFEINYQIQKILEEIKKSF